VGKPPPSPPPPPPPPAPAAGSMDDRSTSHNSDRGGFAAAPGSPSSIISNRPLTLGLAAVRPSSGAGNRPAFGSSAARASSAPRGSVVSGGSSPSSAIGGSRRASTPQRTGGAILPPGVQAAADRSLAYYGLRSPGAGEPRCSSMTPPRPLPTLGARGRVPCGHKRAIRLPPAVSDSQRRQPALTGADPPCHAACSAPDPAARRLLGHHALPHLCPLLWGCQAPPGRLRIPAQQQCLRGARKDGRKSLQYQPERVPASRRRQRRQQQLLFWGQPPREHQRLHGPGFGPAAAQGRSASDPQPLRHVRPAAVRHWRLEVAAAKRERHWSGGRGGGTHNRPAAGREPGSSVLVNLPSGD